VRRRAQKQQKGIVNTHPELTQEIDDTEPGPATVAYFDFDGTIIFGFSVASVFVERITSGKLAPGDAIRQFFQLIGHGLNGSDYATLLEEAAELLAGSPESDFEELGKAVFEKYLAGAVYPESRALIRAHQRQGHTVAIVSSATRYQIEPVARELGIEHVICNHFETVNGEFTGEIRTPIVLAEGKQKAAEIFASERGSKLQDAFFYSDGYEDLPLLEAVGYPRPLNPDSRLQDAARFRNWPTRSFSSRGFPGLREFVRTGLVYGAFFTSALQILPTWFLNQSRRDAVNLAVMSWGEFGSALAGIKTRITGEHYLWEQRPAVFLFNHQSAIDVIIIAKLLRKDFTAIAKHEIARNPLVGPVFRVADTVFVDRKNQGKAIEALKPVVKTLRDGLSVAIAPEGTRSAGDNLGVFKKGPFHVAMQAGVPVVPIVIHNATDVLPKGAFFVRPAVVHVDVLPPVDTSKWKAETIDQHVADVRSDYLRVLGQQIEPAARLKRVK
jgi:putative phosphoserine phosphatase/1-acylglycerol-3-phosphate O-acyltransferase